MPRQPTPRLVADRLHSAAIHLLRRLRTEDEVSGLSAPQLSALSVIVFGGPIALGDLARAEQVRAPTISRLVTDLESAGLIVRSSDPTDARIRRVAATPLGTRMLEEGRARRVRRLEADLRRLPVADFVVVARAVGILGRLSRPTEG